MASRKLTDLCPELQAIVPKFVEACAELGIDVLIHCTWRGEAEQNKVFAEGKSKLKYPKSKHNAIDENGKPAARAFDAVPYKGRTCQWSDVSSYEKMGEVAEDLGLEWGGRWGKFRDRPHFQLRE